MMEDETMWTRFMDMHSGGGTKVWRHADGTYGGGSSWWPEEGSQPIEYIYIEAPEAEARAIFYNRFGRNPDRVTCTCCGEDYSVSEAETLARASGYDRNCAWEGDGYVEKEDPRYAKYRSTGDSDFGRYQTVEQYAKRPNILIIRADEIADGERAASIPAEGYVWVG